jgi:hypothetical protein
LLMILWNRCCVTICLREGEILFIKLSSSSCESKSCYFTVRYSVIACYISGLSFIFFMVEVANSILSCNLVPFLLSDYRTTLIVPRIEPSMKELDNSKIEVAIA